MTSPIASTKSFNNKTSCGLVVYTTNSIKVVFPKAKTVNYECARDDGLLFIFALILGKLLL